MPQQTRCVGVAVFVLRHALQSVEVLLLKRAGGGFEGEWCPVAGKVESNESPAQAAAREAEEETALPLTSLQETQIRVLHAATGNPPTGHIQLFVGFTNSGAEVSLNREHSEFRWVEFDEAVRLISLEGQRRAVREIERVFVRGEPAAPLLLTPPREALGGGVA